MSKSLRVAGGLCCLFAVLIMNGGHWAALQTVAWGRMLIVFSQHDSLGEALVKTFSGQHPCSLCVSVREGLREQQQEQKEKTPLTASERLPEPLWELRQTVPPAPQLFAHCDQPVVPRFTTEFLDSPPTPPPRA